MSIAGKPAAILMGYVGEIGQQEGMELLAEAADILIRKLGRTRVLDQLSWDHSVPHLLAAYNRIYRNIHGGV